MHRKHGMWGRRVVCAFGAWVACGLAWAEIEETMVPDVHLPSYFDRDAPTVLIEDVVEFRKREGAQAQEKRNDEREDAAHQETKRRQDACFANAGPVRSGNVAAAPKPLRKDLEGKTLMELVQLQQQRPDPEIEAAIMQRAQADAAKVGMPGGASPLQSLAGTMQRQGSPLDAKVAESMRRQEQAASPAVQACLATAEVIPQHVPVKLSVFDSTAFLAAEDGLREARGRIVSVVVSIGDTFKTGDGRKLGHPQRFNVVLRNGPRAGLAVPLQQAVAASYRPNRANWPPLAEAQKVAEVAPTEPAAPEQPKKKPTAEGFTKSAKELFEQLKGVPR
jgi:hypothetical protein